MEQRAVKQTVRRMTEARALLIKENPFFGHLAMGLKLACAPCGTACTDGSRLIFDPDFAERLSDRELEFVILHEVLHCVLEHCLRSRGLNNELYNIACDMVVNSTILDMWGLDTMPVAGQEPMHVAPDGREGRDYNAEEIYHMLLKQGNKAAGSKGSGTGRGGGDSYAEDSCPAIDRHDIWQGICDKAVLKDSWNGRIKGALAACGDSPGMPQSVRRVVESLARRAGLEWKQILHDFIQYDLYDYTFLPPDRRYSSSDFFLPAYNVDEINGSAKNLWVCVDTSGSISDTDLACAMVEILDAMRQAGLKGRISFFDSNITEPVPFETEEDVKKILPSGGGGTSFHIIFRYLREKWTDELPKAIIIISDGYAAWPKESEAIDVPVLWLLTKDGRKEAPWGRSVKF